MDESDPFRKQISFVCVAELFSGHGKRWAGQPACKQVNAIERTTVKFPQVLLEDIPFFPIASEGVAAVWIDLNQCRMLEASHLEPESLTSGSSAQFHCGHLFHAVMVAQQKARSIIDSLARLCLSPETRRKNISRLREGEIAGTF